VAVKASVRKDRSDVAIEADLICAGTGNVRIEQKEAENDNAGIQKSMTAVTELSTVFLLLSGVRIFR
jgi:hypothetical protein